MYYYHKGHVKTIIKKMKLYLDGRGFRIEDLTKEELMAVRRMIDGASLEERRMLYGLKQQIDYFEKNDIL